MGTKEVIRQAKEEVLLYEFVFDFINRNYFDYKLCQYSGISKSDNDISFYISDDTLTLHKSLPIKDFQKYLRKQKLERILK